MRRRSALIREGHRIATPYAFPQFNTGVVLYRRSDVVARLLSDWAQLFGEAKATRDQPILRDLLWESDIRFYVLPPEFNLRRVTLLDAWEPLDVAPTILHSHRLMDHMRKGAPRIADIPALLDAERAALEDEWATRGGRDDDPIRRFDD